MKYIEKTFLEFVTNTCSHSFLQPFWTPLTHLNHTEQVKSSWVTKSLTWSFKTSPLSASEITAARQALPRNRKQHHLSENAVGIILHPSTPTHYYSHKSHSSWKGGKGRKGTHCTLWQSATNKNYPSSKQMGSPAAPLGWD